MQGYANMKRPPLSIDELRRRVPAVFAEAAAPTMGERYTFIPSYVAVEQLGKMGLVPVDGSQRSARSANQSHARHLVRFARKEDLLGKGLRKVGDVIPEIVLSNSHNGRARYNLFAGFFRLACANGLIVSEGGTFGFSARHIGDAASILEQVEEILGRFPKLLARVSAMRATVLTDPQRLRFAQAALEMRYTEEHRGKKPVFHAPFTAEAILLPRRPDDERPDLWTTFNVIQENLIRGGVEGKSSNGRRTVTRDMRDVRKLLTYNTGLWDLAAERIAA